MAALIDMSNGRANIAYSQTTPWHGLGSKLSPNSPLEVWLHESGMDWEAKKTPVLFRDVDGFVHQGDSNIIYRSDTKAQLGVCSDRYQMVQPAEVLEFYRDLVGTQDWNIEVAGCLDGGKRLWALAKTDGQFNVNGTIDRIGTYLLLATSFDGSMATVGKFTSVRVVCNNTLQMSLHSGEAQVAISHSTKFNPDVMKEKLGIYANATSKMQDEVNELAKYRMKDAEAMKFIIAVLEGKDVDVADMSTRSANIVKNVFELYRGRGMGSTLVSSDGTLWGAVNAVTEYVDHHVNSRTDNNRLRSAWFGGGNDTKNKAYENALKLVA